ncbi:hypothetical protein [Bacillus sp. 3255]|uniref:hypothetical protein n=1 Tax=Bacillus sp. 3255 TaxID=2817904 RepID=UPI0028588013|nr:hypothetical protein [Bacillus sp. 3255]MDR6883105.1 hypothetical protein [Bacillus sp. 3255]
MFKYGQIDLATGVCVSVSHLSGEVVADHMIPLTEEDNVNPGDIYSNGSWTPAPPPEPVDPQPTPDQIKIAQLEQETINLMLALTQVYEEKEAEKAAAEQETINNMLAITELYEMILALQGGTE